MLSGESIPAISLQRPSIAQGVPGPLFVLQRSSLEIQIGNLSNAEGIITPQNATVESQDAPVQQQSPAEQSQNASAEQSHNPSGKSHNAPEQSQNAPADGQENKRRRKSSNTKQPRLLPAIPGSPGSSRLSDGSSGGNRSASNSISSVESDEVQVVESPTSGSTKTFRQYRKSEGSPPLLHKNSAVRAPHSARSSPGSGSGGSGSDSPPQGRIVRGMPSPGMGRRLPGIPSGGDNKSKRNSRDSSTSGSPEIEKRNVSRGVDVTDSILNSRITVEYRDMKNGQSDDNGNNLTTTTAIYLRQHGDNSHRGGKTKMRPFSENLDSTTSRLQVPGKKTMKKRTASENIQGLRTEISPDVLRDIEVRL